MNDEAPRRVAVLGARGYVGAKVVEALARDPRSIQMIVAADVRPVRATAPVPGVEAILLDVRSPEVGRVLGAHRVDTVVHLASVVTPPRGMSIAEQYAIDVEGTRNVLDACVATGVRQLIVTSSGAAYGYHPDLPRWIDESCPLRGNDAFPYARHKRLVEELLALYRAGHPAVRQLVLRPGTILGRGTHNQITRLFEGRVILEVAGGDSRFVFAWDEDVVACIVKGIHERREGTFNVAGDGAIDAREIASITGARVMRIPAGLLAAALRVGRALGLTAHGPGHVPFLQFRPVLSNAALKASFGFTPTHSSRAALEEWWTYRRGS